MPAHAHPIQLRGNRMRVASLVLLALLLYGCSAGQSQNLEQSSLADRRSTESETGSETPRKLTWPRPATREDGSVLQPEDILGYRIYYKEKHDDEFQTLRIDDPFETSLTLDAFSPGTYLFSISTIDKNGVESQRSDPVEVEVN